MKILKLGMAAVAMLATVQVACADLNAGLVAYYPFNGDANDASGNGHNGTVNGATHTTDRFGNANSAYQFNGAGDIITVPNAADLNFSSTAPMTVALWAYRTTTWPVGHILGKRSGLAYANYQLGYNESSGEYLAFGAFIGAGNEVATGVNLPLNVWQHLVGTFDGATYRFYIDGVLVTNAPGTLGATTTADLKIGGSGSGVTFGGKIDEVRLYNRALTDLEIRQLYTGLVAYYPFDGNANDASGNGNHGVTNGGVTLTTDRFGNPASAYSFNGVDGVVQVPDSPSLRFAPTAPLTVSLWAYRTGTGGVMHLLGKRTGGNIYPYINYQMAFNGPYGLSFGAGHAPYGLETGRDLETNTWKHLVGTFDGATYRFYVDGQLIASTNGVLGNPVEDPLLIGGSGSYVKFNGKIDEVRIYDRALTSAEVMELFLEPRLSIAASQVRLCWNSRTNRNYQVQYRSVLTSNGWANLGSPIPGNGGTECVTDEIVSPQRYYRAIMVP